MRNHATFPPGSEYDQLSQCPYQMMVTQLILQDTSEFIDLFPSVFLKELSIPFDF